VYARCRFSLLFSFAVSIELLYSSQWPQSRVCHYKVFQLSIQYPHWKYIPSSETLCFCLILQWLCSVFTLAFILDKSTNFIFLTRDRSLVTPQQSYSQLNVEQWSLIPFRKTFIIPSGKLPQFVEKYMLYTNMSKIIFILWNSHFEMIISKNFYWILWDSNPWCSPIAITTLANSYEQCIRSLYQIFNNLHG